MGQVGFVPVKLNMKMKNFAVLTALSFAMALVAVGCIKRPDGSISWIRESAVPAPGPSDSSGPKTAAGPITPVVNPQPSNPPPVGPTRPLPPTNPIPEDTNVVRAPGSATTPIVAATTNAPVAEIPLPTRIDPSAYTSDTEKFRGQTVYFEFDMSAVRASEKPKVEAVAEYLKANPNAKLEIEGHADERGTDQYNLSLSERRALSVRETLSALGVSADRVSTLPLGESQPAVAGHNEEAWSKNRRGVFVLFIPKQ